MFENWMKGGKPTETVVKEPQNNTTNTGGDNNAVTKTVSDNDNKTFNDVWNENKPNTGDNNNGGGNNNNNGNNNGGNNQNTQVDPQKVLADHMREMGLEPITLSDQDLEAFKSGENINDVLGRINKQVQNSYVNSMKNMDKLVDTKVAKALEQANANTSNMLEGVKLKEFIEAGIPYLKGNPVLSPVAETVFKRFYEKTDKNRDKALELTKRFLKETATEVNTNDPDMMRQFSSGGYRGAPDKNGDQNWLDALRS